MKEMRVVRGMRDLLPEQASIREKILEVCKHAFESYGFEPLETPIVEEFDLLAKKGTGGEAIKNEIYYFKDKGNRELGLRFDLTVPLARVVANNPQLTKPFKRYAIGKVYRYDRPQAKRYREFTQADLDIVGSKSVVCEYECIAVIVKVMKELEIDFYIKINDRVLLEELAQDAGIKKDKIVDCLRSLDKLDKIGENGVKKELKEKGIPTGIVEKLSSDFEDYKDNEGAAQLQELLSLLKENKLDSYVKVDISLARGLEYYTGMVFELCVKEGPSIGGGGRYDKLVGTYGKEDIPATGFSFGIDRIIDLLEEKIVYKPKTMLFIANIGNTQKEAIMLAEEARASGVNTETDLMNRGISKNLAYADKKGIPFVVVLGENEVKSGKVKVKNMKSGNEKEVLLKNFGKEIKDLS